MKKTIFRLTTCILLSAMIWFGGTWIFIGHIFWWSIILPVCMGLIGICSGICIKKYWVLPLMQPLFFPAVYWLLGSHFWAAEDFGPNYTLSKGLSIISEWLPVRIIQDIFTSDIITYTVLYLMIALTAMLFSALIVRLLKRKKAAPDA